MKKHTKHNLKILFWIFTIIVFMAICWVITTLDIQDRYKFILFLPSAYLSVHGIYAIVLTVKKNSEL